jgi:hypothetical protein
VREGHILETLVGLCDIEINYFAVIAISTLDIDVQVVVAEIVTELAPG